MAINHIPAGLASNVSPHLLAPGTMRTQTNWAIYKPGVWQGRGGLQPLSFSEGSAGSNIIAVSKCERPETSWLIYELANGTIKAICPTSALSLSTGLNTFQPSTFYRDRQNNLYSANGIDTPQWWDGVASTSSQMGYTAPAAAPTITTTGTTGTIGVGTTLTYQFAFNYIDQYGNTSSLSPIQTVTLVGYPYVQIAANASSGTFALTFTPGGDLPSVTTAAIAYNASNSTIQAAINTALGVSGTGPITVSSSLSSSRALIFSFGSTSAYPGTIPTIDTSLLLDSLGAPILATSGVSTITTSVEAYPTFSWSFAAPSDSRIVNTQLFRTTADEGSVFYLVTTRSNSSTSFTPDDAPDATLALNTALPLEDPNTGLVIANAYTPPPNDKPFLSGYQDRMFFYGSVSYNAGTIGATSSSGTFTITGGVNHANFVGRMLYIQSAGNAVYAAAITSISSTNVVVTGTNWPHSTASGLTYAIEPGPAERGYLYWSQPDLPMAVPATNADPIQQANQDNDPATGLMQFGGALWLLHSRHLHRMTFVQQPDEDMTIEPPISRGCVNNRSWVTPDGSAYLMDQTGPYRIGPDSSIDAKFALPVQNYWRDGIVDFTQSKWWWAEFEPNDRVVRFCVSFVADGSTRPKRALAYNTSTGQWWDEQYEWELGGGARLDIAGKNRLVIGGESDVAYVAEQGTSDGVTAAIIGTVTSASGTTLNDSNASFTSAVTLAPVYIYAGTGAGQHFRATYSSGTALTLSGTPSPALDATSQYMIGGIALSMSSGLMEYQPIKGSADREASDDSDTERSLRLTFQPTTTANSLLLEIVQDHGTAPASSLLSYAASDGVQYIAGSPDAGIPMQSTQSPLGSEPGYKRIIVDSTAEDDKTHDRWLSFNLKGYQGPELLQVYGIIVQGVA